MEVTSEKNIIEILPIQEPVDLELNIPGSKSITHRAFIMAALANGVSLIENSCLCSDTLMTLNALKSMGVKIEENSFGITIHGNGGHFEVPSDFLFFGNSGTSFRFFVTLCTLADRPITIMGNSQMDKRPIGGLVDALLELGCEIMYLKKTGFPPLKIFPGFKGGLCHLKGNVSSQYFSSILISSPFAQKPIQLQPISEIRSRPYIDITINVMDQFGIQVQKKEKSHDLHVSNKKKYSAVKYFVEGDFSSASYFFAAVAICGGKIKIKGLNSSTCQGDMNFLDILRRMGCQVRIDRDSIQLSRNSSEKLAGISIDMGDCPDIVQSLCIVASFASSASYISNIPHLKHKETDRIEATASELRKIGVGVETNSQSMKIIPKKKYHGAQINTYNDHRMAMAFSIMGLKIPNILIENPSCVEKSFPHFFEILEKFYQ